MKKVSLVSFTLLLLGCVEHSILIRVYPEGESEFRIRSAGDSLDIVNDDFLHPAQGQFWKTILDKTEVDGDPVWTQQTSGFLTRSPVQLPGVDYAGIQNYSYYIDKQVGWITTTYSFLQEFSGREIYTKVPLLGESIRNKTASDSTQWKMEAMQYVIKQGIMDIKHDQSLDISFGLEERLITHFQNYFNRVNYEQSFEQLSKDKSAFLSDVLAPFKNELPSHFIDTLAHAMAPFEHDISTTHGLQDDQFTIGLLLPGRIVSTNADTIIGDTLQWSFSIEEFMQDPKIMQAESMIISISAFQKLILGTTIVILLVLGSLWIKFR